MEAVQSRWFGHRLFEWRFRAKMSTVLAALVRRLYISPPETTIFPMFFPFDNRLVLLVLSPQRCWRQILFWSPDLARTIIPWQSLFEPLATLLSILLRMALLGQPTDLLPRRSRLVLVVLISFLRSRLTSSLRLNYITFSPFMLWKIRDRASFIGKPNTKLIDRQHKGVFCVPSS
jgi:hypothetical protein